MTFLATREASAVVCPLERKQASKHGWSEQVANLPVSVLGSQHVGVLFFNSSPRGLGGFLNHLTYTTVVNLLAPSIDKQTWRNGTKNKQYKGTDNGYA